MEEQQTAEVQGQRTKFTAEQLASLSKAYSDGLCSTGIQHCESINNLASSCNLPYKVVRDWIKNRGRKPKKAFKAKAKLGIHKTAWNLFCSDSFSEGQAKNLSNAERFQAAKLQYASLSAADKLRLKKEAHELSNPTAEKLKELDVDERKSLALYHTKEISKRIAQLHNLGFASFCVIGDSTWSTAHASSIGAQFVDENDMTSRFSDFIRSKESKTKKWTAEDVRRMFNQKWIEAGGKGSSPAYSNRSSFEVLCMPEGVPFHRPSDYGRIQLDILAKHGKDISFVMAPPRSAPSHPSVACGNGLPGNDLT